MALGNLLVSIRASASAWASDVKAIQREAKELERSVKPLTTAFADIGKAASVAGLAIVGAFAVAIKSAADYGDEINDAAKRTGVATESLSKLRLAAETSGSSFDGLTTGLKFLGKNMELANAGSKEQIKAFAAAGISAKDLAAAHGDVNKVFTQLADTFSGAEDGAGKTAISMALLGKSGTDLIPMLNEGSAGLKKWGDEAQRAGRVVSAETAAAADEFNDQLRILEVSVLGLSGSIGNALIPKMTEWVTEGTKVIQQVKDWTRQNQALMEGLGLTGIVLAGTGGILVSVAALPALLTKVQVAWAALTATISLSTLGLAAALTAIIVFRKQIAEGLIAALATAVKGLEDFTNFAAKLADKIGLGGLATKLHEASFSAGTFRKELDDTVTMMILEGRAAELAADQTKAQGAAHVAASVAVKKNRIELETLKDTYSNYSLLLEAYIKTVIALEAQEVARLKVIREINAELERGLRLAERENILRGGVPGQPIHVPTVFSPFEQENANLAAARRRLAELRAQGQAVIDQWSNSLSKMFTDAIGHSKTFWEAFKGLGKDAIAAVADVFIKTLVHSFLDPLKEQFGKWQESLTKWMQSNKQLLALAAGGAAVGAAATHGSVGGTVAGAAAGVALSEAMKGDWVGAAIAGVVAVGAAMTTMIHQLHQLATKFVNEVQNKMTDSVKSLFDGLTDAKEMGTLTVDQVKQARRSFEKMWTDFQSSAAAAGVVGQQGLATMTPFIASWRDWLESLDAAAAALERLAAVTSIRNTVLEAAKGWDIMEEAILSLMESGVSTTQIIAFLGGDITRLAENLRTLGYAVPPAMQAVIDAIDVEKALKKATDEAAAAIRQLDQDLQSVFDQLTSALIQKLDFLDNAIAASQQKISDWTDQIASLNEDIKTQTEHLADAAYWQKQYDDVVQESANNFKRLTDERQSIEKRIVSLTNQIERERLVSAVEAAKKGAQATTMLFATITNGVTANGHVWNALNTSLRTFGGSTADLEAAQRALDEFDAMIQEQERQSRLTELKDLQTRLPEVIRQQKEAEEAYAQASVAAQANIELEKEATRLRIKGDIEKRDALLKLISLENARVETLIADRTATEALMRSLGISRLDELTKINNSITALQARGLALIEERARLEGVAGASSSASVAIAALIEKLNSIGTLTPTTPDALKGLPPFAGGSTAGNVASDRGATLNFYIDKVEASDPTKAVQEMMAEVNRQVRGGSAFLMSTEVRR